MRKLIIDCDPGHDDAIAIFMAYAHKNIFDLKAITTVCGNNTVENMVKNASYIISIAKENTRFAKGSLRPLINEPIISSEFHGVTGMDGDYELPCVTIKEDSKNSVEVMKEILDASEDKVSIVAIGPLTNIAILIRLYPELISKIEMISIMGGSLYHGNITKQAEFNIYVDPEAAEIVFDSNIPIVMSGLNLTEKASIYPEEFEYLKDKGAVGKFFCELMDFYIQGSKKHGTTGCVMHDPCAIAYLIAPEIFTGIETSIRICLHGNERGKTIIDEHRKSKVMVLTDLNRKKLSELIIKSIERLCVADEVRSKKGGYLR